MSGKKYKTITVRDDVWRRTQEDANRFQTLNSNLPNLLNNVREAAQQDFQQRFRPLEQRLQGQAREIDGFRTNIRDMERETNRRLQQQQRDFQRSVEQSEQRQQQALNRSISRLETAMEQGFSQQRQEYLTMFNEQRKETHDLIDQCRGEYTEMVKQEREARQKGERILQKQIDQVVDNIEQERLRKETLALDLLADVEKVWQDIDQNYQHQRFAPGKLANLHRGLEMAQMNIDSGVTQTAIANCQQTYLQLADLRVELAQKEQEWQLLYNEALKELRLLLTEAKGNREVSDPSAETEAEKSTYPVDYWSNGQLSEYEQQLKELDNQLIQGEKTLTTEQVKEINKTLEKLQPRLGEILEEATLNIVSSLMRVEIADSIVEVLEEWGYQIVDEEKDAIYEGDDQRKAFVVKVQKKGNNGQTGEEVVIVVTPDKDSRTNTIAINTFSDFLDENFARQKSEAIFESLGEQGVQAQGSLQDNHAPDERYRDLEKVKQRPVEQVQQQVQGNQ